MLTAEQRYRQAILKQRIVGARRLRYAIQNDTGFIPMTDARTFLIDALDRAYKAGLRDGEQNKDGTK